MEFEEVNNLAIEATENRLKRANFQADINQTIIHLSEEFGEIAYQRNNELIRKQNPDQKNMGEEISDCIILLMFLASQYKINLKESLLNKIKDINHK